MREKIPPFSNVRVFQHFFASAAYFLEMMDSKWWLMFFVSFLMKIFVYNPLQCARGDHLFEWSRVCCQVLAQFLSLMKLYDSETCVLMSKSKIRDLKSCISCTACKPNFLMTRFNLSRISLRELHFCSYIGCYDIMNVDSNNRRSYSDIFWSLSSQSYSTVN